MSIGPTSPQARRGFDPGSFTQAKRQEQIQRLWAFLDGLSARAIKITGDGIARNALLALDSDGNIVVASTISSGVYTFPQNTTFTTNLRVTSLGGGVVVLSNEDIVGATYACTLPEATGVMLVWNTGGGGIQPAAGALLYGAGVNAPMDDLVIGAVGTILTSSGAAPQWSTMSSVVDQARTWATLQKFKDTTFQVVDDGDNTKTLVLSLGGASAGADLTLAWAGTADHTVTIPDSTTVLAGLSTVQSFLADQTFTQPVVIDNADAGDVLLKLVPHASQSADTLQIRNSGDTFNKVNYDGSQLFIGSASFASALTLFADPSGGAWPIIVLVDNASGFQATLDVNGFTANRAYTLPDSSGTILLSTSNTATAFSLRSNTPSLGASFFDTTTTTKRLRMILSGSVGNNTITITNTAARNYGLGDLSGNVVIVGDDAPAVASGALGKVDATAQTADITTTALSNTPPAGMYEVEVYLETTTADAAAGTLAVTIGWTDDVGATTSVVIAAHSLAATGRSTGRALIRLASSDITYAVAQTGGYGTSAYAVFVRVVSKG